MIPAHITRLMTFAQHGQPKDYAASDLMRADLGALIAGLSDPPRFNEAEIGAACRAVGVADGIYERIARALQRKEHPALEMADQDEGKPDTLTEALTIEQIEATAARFASLDGFNTLVYRFTQNSLLQFVRAVTAHSSVSAGTGERCRVLADEVLGELKYHSEYGWNEEDTSRVAADLLTRVYDTLNILAMAGGK